MRYLGLVSGWLAACWAPEIADLPPEGPTPAPAAAAPQPRGAPPPALAEPQAELAAEPVPTLVPATERGDLPQPPFSAWTTEAPLTLVGPGGASVATIDHLGVRVEVLQVLPARLRVTCAGCTGATAGVEGWLPHGSVRAARTAGTRRDPLSVALMQRASWAGGQGLPEGGTNGAACLLVDRGFLFDGQEAVWEAEGGRLVLRYAAGAWQVEEATPPLAASPWSCRTGVDPAQANP